MSTRANIIVTDGYNELIFYRHSDGYPDGAMPLLEAFLSMVQNNQIRNNVCQASGWLVILGYSEYNGHTLEMPNGDGLGWKVGAIEPTVGIHGDIEYLYVVDLKNKEIKIDGKNGFKYQGKFNES